MYFQDLPTTTFEGFEIDNLTVKFEINNTLRNDTNRYDLYTVMENEKPEDVSYMFYGKTEYHWIVLGMNNMVDPVHDWLMNDSELTKYVGNNYDDIDAVHHWELGGYVVDEGTIGAASVSNFEHEERLNFQKKEIKVLKKIYLQQLIQELKDSI